MRQQQTHRTFTNCLAVLCAGSLFHCRTNAAIAQAPAMQPASAVMSAEKTPAAGVVLNNASFDIPFSVERTGAQPVEVQLFVSRDRGKTWALFARQPATESGFPFQADEDGDFWFSTRTIDAQGVSYPIGPTMTPQLRVLVDTTNPQVQANVDTDMHGQIVLDYVVTDVAPDEDYLHLEYMTDAVRQWMPVTIQGRPGRRPGDGALVGRITWQPQTPWRNVHVRMIVRDKAGNQTVFNDQLERPRVATNPMAFANNPYPQAAGVPTHPVSDRPELRSGAMLPGAVPAASSAPYQQPSSMPSPYRGAGPMTARPVSNQPGFGLNAPIQRQQPVGRQFDTSASPAQEPNSAESQADALQPDRRRPAAPREAFRPLRGTQASASSKNEAGAESELEPASGVPASKSARTLPPNDTPRVTRSKQFSLDYEVESVGNGGIEAVELWGTRDGGQTWQRWDADPDKQSPFDIEVSKEGLVGFRIVIVAANGLTTPRPAAGDPADIYVLVDTTAPQVRLTGATYGEDSYTGSLIIDYACHDENLGARPISLAFSDRPDGQWTTIATGLANTGRYIWPADPQLPREIYLRVEATDKAGNVGIHALDVPVSVQGLSPQGRINGFQPIEGEPEATQTALPSARFR